MERRLVDSNIAGDVELLRRRIESKLVGPEGDGNGRRFRFGLSQRRARPARRCQDRRREPESFQ
jgi:hypothetical protein